MLNRKTMIATVTGLLVVTAQGVLGAQPPPENAEEPVALSLYLDNDVMTGSDSDYTGGFAVAFNGEDARKHPISIDGLLSQANHAVGLEEKFNHDLIRHICEAGLVAFTPTDIASEQPIDNDRPYSSLVYVSNTKLLLSPDRSQSLMTTLSIGALGLSATGDIQNAIHGVIGSENAEGWDNQISEGGEPTAKYSATYQRYWDTGLGSLQATTAAGLSLGYITEAFIGTSLRTGIISTPPWSFNVFTSNYGEKANVTLPVSDKANAFYLVAGANLKARGYNAFLQGQFRDSEVSYSASETRRLVAEGWIGIASEFRGGFRLNFILRKQTSELKTGLADRSFSYGELITTYQF